MKIAFFTDCYLDLTGGITTAINAEKEELERRGHTVQIYSSAYPRSDREKQALAKKHIFPVPSCKIFGRGATPIARRPRVIEKWLMKNHPELQEFDIFYVHYEAGCSIAGLRLGSRLGIPTVQVMHGREDVGEAHIIPLGLRTFVAVMLDWFHSWYLPHPLKVRRDDYFAKTIASAKMWTLMVNHANYADLVITPSENFRNILTHYGVAREIVSLHHGVPDELTRTPVSPRKLSDNEKLRIVWHSRLSGEKRILPFLEALNLITEAKPFRATHSPYHLDVYGDGPDHPLAVTYAKLHRLDVAFHGNTDFKEIEQTIKEAHLDVLVSYNYDTFGMILIEAEALGTPVMIVDPALGEIVPTDGYILSAGPTPEQMAASIMQLIGCPSKVEEMSKIMIKNRHQVKISTSADRLESVFRELIRSRWKTSAKSPKNL
ncbi:glycosyltransferase family 4 protein [Candidatus Saccharibacteria bacterium]|nr:glycosyltransferase family 4 protein [Candidatus Saccharibacteria bacterium]